jgi:LmbE family N-acetylglucosaminyl deacetylase
MKKIMIVAPHPDDAYIGCAGYVLSNTGSCEVDILCLTNKNLKPSPNKRLEEEIEAWTRIEDYSRNPINIHIFEDGVDTALFKQLDTVINYIESFLRSSEYQCIFTPFLEDSHQDHTTVTRATIAAARYQRNILFYETPSSFNFNPTIFAELEAEEAHFKTESAKSYDSQIFGGAGKYTTSLYEYIDNRLISNGLRSRVCKYAEGFIPYRRFMN